MLAWINGSPFFSDLVHIQYFTMMLMKTYPLNAYVKKIFQWSADE